MTFSSVLSHHFLSHALYFLIERASASKNIKLRSGCSDANRASKTGKCLSCWPGSMEITAFSVGVKEMWPRAVYWRVMGVVMEPVGKLGPATVLSVTGTVATKGSLGGDT